MDADSKSRKEFEHTIVPPDLVHFRIFPIAVAGPAAKSVTVAARPQIPVAEPTIRHPRAGAARYLTVLKNENVPAGDQ